MGTTESTASSESLRASKRGLDTFRQAMELLEGYGGDYATDPTVGSVLDIGAQTAGQEPYSESLIDSMISRQWGSIERESGMMEQHQGQMYDTKGLGRSEAGGVGLANQLRAKALADKMTSASQIEQQAAAANQQAALQQAMAQMGLIDFELAPLHELAAAQVGAPSQLAPLIGATGTHSGPVDFTGGGANIVGGFLGQGLPSTAGSAAGTNAQGFTAAGQALPAAQQSAVSGATTQAGNSAFSWLCWIAIEIYGADDARTHFARHYLMTSRHPVVRGLAWLYRRVGRRVAAVAKRSSLVRRMLRPLFNVAWRRGMEV